MQKRSKTIYRLEYSPVSLPADFPVTDFSGVYRQSDKPITRLHIHDCLEIGYCHSGAGIFVVEDKIFPYRQGDVSVINRREMHLARSRKGTFSEWTFIALDPLKLLGARAESTDALDTLPFCGPHFRNIVAGRQHGDIAWLARELAAELAQKRPGYQACVRGLVWTLLSRLRRLPGRHGLLEAGSRRENIERLAPALQYMAARYMENLRVENLAKACFMSLTNFRRLFKQAVHKTPLEYLAGVRIQMASVLLADSAKTILEISLEVGYQTISSFNRQFKSALGMPPRAWRKLAAASGRGAA